MKIPGINSATIIAFIGPVDVLNLREQRQETRGKRQATRLFRCGFWFKVPISTCNTIFWESWINTAGEASRKA